MAFRKLFFKRVNETRSNFLLAEGDIALDESTFTLFRGDGTTVGGVAIAGLGASISEDTSPSLGGDLDTNGNSIISASNANINIVPNGTGDVTLQTDTVQIGDSNTNATITTNGTGDLTLNTNSGTDSGSIVIADAANGNITITPNGSGQVVLDGLSFPTADGSANQVLQTDGSGNLSFATISTGGLGNIVEDTTPQLGGDLDINGQDIVSSSNANIDIAPDGTGDILLKTDGSAGRVGMGTVGNPDTALHIKSSASIITLQRTNDSKTPGISFQNSNGNTRGSVKIDGTGGTSNEIFMETYDGSSQAERFRVQHTGAKVTGILKIGDGSATDNYAGFGDADDLKIFHNGSHSIIRETGTGSLYVQSDNNVILGSDSGSETYVKGIYNGAVELYHNNVKKFDTGSHGVDIVDEAHIEGATPHLTLKRTDNANVPTLRFKGSGGVIGASIGFDGTSGTSNELIMQTYDGSSIAERFRVTYTGIKVTGLIDGDVTGSVFSDDSTVLVDGINATLNSSALTKPIRFADDEKAIFGTGDDLQIWHNATNSIIQNATGQLQLRGNTIRLLNAATTKDLAFFNDGGSVDLYHNNSKKFETTATGISVTGVIGGTAVKDEDDMASDSNTHLASQQSIKAFVEGKFSSGINSGGLEPAGVSSGGGNNLTITGGDTSASSQNGGGVLITGGTGGSGGSAGTVSVGASNTTSISIGASGIGTTVGGDITFNGDAIFNTGTEEAFHTVTGASGVTALDCDNGHIFYKTGCTGDITANFTNLGLTAEYATNLTVIINQGGTPYEVTAVQIGGSAQTINWQGGSQPTGNANGIDAFSFTILNDGGTYVVLGQMVDFT